MPPNWWHKIKNCAILNLESRWKMKKKIKLTKSNLICFILGALIFGLVGVSAATYFPSSQTIYDNKESGLKSTDVQGAIDELYNACKTPSAGGIGILERVPIVTTGDGLYEDEYEDGRYLFKGGNPNNYVTFNNEQAGWRIISVEPDKTIKIMKIANINTSSNLTWDTSGSIGSNNWARPASLNTYLNRIYYNSLNSAARSQIVASNFSIGLVTSANNDMSTQVSNENSNKWYGKIALPTVSEYLRTNSNKSICGTIYLMLYNSSSCVSTGWMDTTSIDFWWTLSPMSHSSDRVFYVLSNGEVFTYSSGYYSVDYNAAGVRPVVYLSSNIKITGGNGSQSNPYTIE